MPRSPKPKTATPVRTRKGRAAPAPKPPDEQAPSDGEQEEAAEREGEAVDAEPVEPSPDELSDEEIEESDHVPQVAAPVTALARSEGAALARKDPLAAYMAEVHKHPLLTREQEHELAVQYRATGDLRSAAKLVASNLRLVVKLAHEYHRNPLSLLDLIQEGNIGLMQAVKKYDPDRGVKLSSYAAWWIRAYILRYIMDNWKMVKLGTTEAQRKLFFKLRQEQEKLLAQGFEASPKLLAERLNVSEQDVVEMDQRLGGDEVSLDAPLSDDSKLSRSDRMLPSSTPAADERLASEELKAIFREKLAELAKTLKDKEKYIYEKRLIADEPITLQEIGDHFGVSRERARQIEAGLINRIREYLRDQMPDFDLMAVPKS